MFMVLMKSHVKVWGGVGREETLSHTKSELDNIMVVTLF